MTKKKVTTTYRREYSPERSAKQTAVIRSFGANFNYRGYRRQIEHGHHKSPFVWEDWEYELADQSSPPAFSEKRRMRAVKKPYLISQSSDSGSDSCEGSNSSLPRDRNEPPKGRHSNSSDSNDCNCGAKHEKDIRVQDQPARFLSDTISKSLKKVSKRSAQPDVDGSRPRSAPVDDTPFAQYGAGDSEEETGNKRTHNILSRQGVYPSANDAMHRHKSAKELRSHQPVKEVKSKTVLHDPRFDTKMNKQTSKWQSEYNKRYRQYPTCHYK